MFLGVLGPLRREGRTRTLGGRILGIEGKEALLWTVGDSKKSLALNGGR